MSKLPERLVNGSLPAFAWPGGYPVFYLDSENSVLCADCATKSADDPDEIPQFKPIAYDIHWEGDSLFCEQCSVEIESAYGDPEEDEQEADNA
jgi:hypothetical protein